MKNINEVKDKLKLIVDYTLFQSNDLNSLYLSDIKEIINYLNKSMTIKEDIKDILGSANNENLFIYEKYVKYFLKEIKIDYVLIAGILNSDLNYNIKIIVWNKLSNQEKLDYLEEVRYINHDITRLINDTIYNTKNNKFIKSISDNKRILNKLKDGSLKIRNNQDNVLNNIELLNKTDAYSISNIVMKNYFEFDEFSKFIKCNYYIIDLLGKYSISLGSIKQDELNNLVIEYPTLITKLDTPISIKYIYNNTLDKLLTNSGDKEIINCCKELLIVENNVNVNDIFNEEMIKNAKLHSLSIYPFKKISKDLIDKIANNYSYLEKFRMDVMIAFVNEYGNDSTRENILRNDKFIELVNSNDLEELLCGTSFKMVFNMLQNVKILNKVNSLKVKIDDSDKIFIPGYLDSPALVNKTHHTMLKNCLGLVDDAYKYIKLPYINSKLTTKEVLDIAIMHNIKLNDLILIDGFIGKVSKNELAYYIDNMWSTNGINYDLIFNDFVFDTLFCCKFSDFNRDELDEIKYLYDLLYTRGVTTIKSYTLGVLSFKSILASYKILGIKDTERITEIGNRNVKLDNIKEFKNKYVDYQDRNYQEILDNSSDIAKRVIDELDTISIIDFNNEELFKKLLLDNKYLSDLIVTMDSCGYNSINNSVTVFANFLKYRVFNEEDKINKLNEFFKEYNNYLIEYNKNKNRNIFDDKTKKHYKIKSNIKFNKQKILAKNFLNDWKFKIIVETLITRDKSDFKMFYKDDFDIDNIEENFKNSLSKNEILYDDILRYVLIPYANFNKNPYVCLDNMGIMMPPFYMRYQRVLEEKKLVEKINGELNKLLGNMHITRKRAIINYICYNYDINFDIDNATKEVIDKYKEDITNLEGKIDLDDANGCLVYTSNYNNINEDEQIVYGNYVDIINMIVKKTLKFANKYVDELKIKEVFRNEYTIAVNKLGNEEYPLDNRHYELVKRRYYLDDLVKMFGNVNLDYPTLYANELKEFLLNNNLVYGAEGYYDDLLDLSDIINNWDIVMDYVCVNDMNICELNVFIIKDIINEFNKELNADNNKVIRQKK